MSFERGSQPTSRADQTTVRRANLGVVLQQIAGGEPRSRARVAAETGLTRGTVSSLVGELIELDLLRETGEDARSGTGRPAGADARAGRPGRRDRPRGQRRLPRGVRRGPDRDGPVRAARPHRQPALEARPRAEPPGADGRGGACGRSLPRIWSPPAPPWRSPASSRPRRARCSGPRTSAGRRSPSPSELAERLAGLPVRADNEANLAALAEHWQGVARDVENFICVFGEVGVGGGIFVDGELFRGAHGYGGEFGHLTVDPDGPPCKCGSTGCLETFVGQEAIAERAGIAVGAGRRARNLTRSSSAAQRTNDPAVLRSLSEAGRYLGIGLASAVNLFDVDVVVLGGCFGPLAPWLADDVSAVLGERVLSSAWSGCEVRASEFGEGAAVRGAAALTLTSVLAEPWLVAERAGTRHGKGFLTMRVRRRPRVCWSFAGAAPERTTKEVSAALELLVHNPRGCARVNAATEGCSVVPPYSSGTSPGGEVIVKKFVIASVVALVAVSVAVTAAFAGSSKSAAEAKACVLLPDTEVVGSLADAGPARRSSPPSRRPASRPRS